MNKESLQSKFALQAFFYGAKRARGGSPLFFRQA